MCLVLLEVIDAHQEVCITCLQAFFVEELLNNLNVANVGTFTLLFHVHGVVKGTHEAVGLQDPTDVFVFKHVLVVDCCGTR